MTLKINLENKIFRIMAEVAEESFVVGKIDDDGENGELKIIYANPNTLEMFGYDSYDELIGQNVSIFMRGKEKQEHDFYVSNFRKTRVRKILGKKGRVVDGHKKNGDLMKIKLMITPVEIKGTEYFVGNMRDLTDEINILEEKEKIAEEKKRMLNQLRVL